MAPTKAQTVGKTPAMAFVLDYLREFPGAGYHLVKKAALSHGLPAPAPVIYGNTLRVIRVEGEKAADPVGTAQPARRRRRGAARGMHDLAGLVEQMQAVIADRDRLRAAAAQIRAVIKQARR